MVVAAVVVAAAIVIAAVEMHPVVINDLNLQHDYCVVRMSDDVGVEIVEVVLDLMLVAFVLVLVELEINKKKCFINF